MPARFSVVLALLLCTQLLPAADTEPRYQLRSASAQRVFAEFGALPFDLLRSWTRGESTEVIERFVSGREWPKELLPLRREVLLCGLWHEDAEVAFGAACHIPERLMDVRDIDRYVTLTLPHLFDESLRFDFDTFKHVVSTAQVSRVLSLQPAWESDARHFYISDLHRSMRSVHVPQLCALAQHDDPLVRKQALGVLSNLTHYRDDHPEHVTELLLGWPGNEWLWLEDDEDPSANPRYEPVDRALPLARDGWSPRFRVLLDRMFLKDDAGKVGGWFQDWLARCADAEVASPEHDVERWLALLETEKQMAVRIALRGARPLVGDARVESALRALAADSRTDEGERAAVWLALDARDSWRPLVREDAGALLAAIVADDQIAWEFFASAAFGGADIEAGLEAIELLEEAYELSWTGPVDWPEFGHARIRAAVDRFADQLGARRAQDLAVRFPGCRTKALAEALLAGECPAELDEEVVAMLEVFDEQRLRNWLQKAVTDGHSTAFVQLARLGAPVLHDRLVTWASEDPERFALLGRSAGSGAVFGQIATLAGMADGENVSEAHEASFVALAEFAGLPRRTAASVGWRLADVPHDIRKQHVDGWVALLADRRGVEFLLEFVRVTDPLLDWPTVYGLGSVRDPRIGEHLRTLRKDFGTGDVQDLLLELAIHGDSAARAEIQEVFDRNLYGWMDDAHDDASVLCGDLSLAEYWVGEAGTICCRRNGAAGALETLYAYNVHRVPETAPLTQEQHARQFWERNREHLKFSSLLGRYVVAPR